jgi:hypothetical protein
MTYEWLRQSIGRSRVLAVSVLAALLLAATAPPPQTAAQSRGAPMTDGPVTFGYTGTAQQWTVPPGVHRAFFDVYGAQGGDAAGAFENDNIPGGKGGWATAAFPLTPGDTITIMVGGKGTDPASGAFPCAGGQPTGGFNGGGESGDPDCGQGGGGASDVRIGGTDLAHRVLIAGGGGGATANIFCKGGGDGGGLTGGSAASNVFCPGAGSGGNQTGSSGSGQLGFGGTGAPFAPFQDIGGGGGGGYYGGGGGGHGTGGGGGSGFGPPGGTSFQNGVQQGHGRIVISFLAGPVLTSLSPSSGPEAGGTVVTLDGLNLTGLAATAVDFGSRAATNVHCPSATTCTATSPAGTGTVNVTVVNDRGTSNPLLFTYVPPPTLTSLSPTSGPAAGGTTVTITGARFVPRQTSVLFGTVPAMGVSCSSATQCIATSPPGVGTVDVAVQVLAVKSTNSLPFSYVPAVSSLSTTAGPSTGGTAVTISGVGFSTTPGATTVTFGAAAATGVTCGSTTQCTATSPAGTGTVPVHVTVGGQTSAANPAATFTYWVTPSLTNLTPTAGPIAGGTKVTITGSGFDPMPGATTVTFGSAHATMVQCSPTSCTAVSPAGTGTVHVTVTTPGGTSSGLPFTYLGVPSLTNISPNTGPEAGGAGVTLSGANLQSPHTTVTFGSAQATMVQCSPTSCTATTPAGSRAVDVVVHTPGGRSNALPYTYVARPALTSLNPSSGPEAGSTVVTLTGANLGGGDSFVTFGSAQAAMVQCSATSCTATSPPGSGTVDVQFVGAGGFSNALSFTYLATPTLTSLTPAQGPAAGGTVVTLSGSGFSTVPRATTVTFGGAPATGVSCQSSTQCTTTTPAGQGSVDVRVTVGGQTSVAHPQARFTYLPPASPRSVAPPTVTPSPPPPALRGG